MSRAQADAIGRMRARASTNTHVGSSALFKVTGRSCRSFGYPWAWRSDFVVVWFGERACACGGVAAVLAAAVGTEVSSGGISGGGGPGLAMVGLGVGPISRLNSLGRSVVFEFPSLSPCPLEVARGPDHDQFLEPLVAMGH